MSAEEINAENVVADSDTNEGGADLTASALNSQKEGEEVTAAERNESPKLHMLVAPATPITDAANEAHATDDVDKHPQDEADFIDQSIETENVSSGTSEDNLHGLSVTASQDSNNATTAYDDGLQQQDSSDMKTERVNPFNISASQYRRPHTVEHQELMAKFVSFGSSGNDESRGNVAGNVIPHDLNMTRMHLDENHTQRVSMAQVDINENHDLTTGGSLALDPPMERVTNSSKVASTDPWVSRVAPNPTPAVGDAAVSVGASAEVERSVSSQDGSKSTQNSNRPLCLEGELKKAPVIDPTSVVALSELNIPGPCEPEDLIEGIIFSANYLGTTQLASGRNSAKNTRMLQAQEAVNRIKAPDGESQPTVEVDLYISTMKVKILNADTQETMMSHTLRSISYIADIGDVLVIMAKRPATNEEQVQNGEDIMRKNQPKQHRIICHVLSSSDSHLIAESIGQCFNVSYQQFLHKNCIEPVSLTQADFNELLDTQEMYHDDLIHYSKQENVKEIWVEKKNGETMGIAIVESGWGSIIPTVILANLQHGSPVERNGKFSIGDQIMAINGTSMVGLPLLTCHGIIKGLRNQTLVKINIVSCPPVVSVLIKRPNLQHQLGFSVQNGIICSLMRGGIAERGGVRVGHRIIEINNQSVVATPHDKIVQTLTTSVGEIQMKTMPAAMYRLLTGQEQPIYL